MSLPLTAVYCFLLTTPDGLPAVALGVCYSGPLERGEAVIRPLRTFGSPLADLVQPLPYPAMQSLIDAAAPPGLHYYWKASFLTEVSDAAIETFVEHANQAPSPLSAVILEYYGGAASRVGERETAFPHRQPLFSLVINAAWPTPAESEANIGWARGLWTAVQPFGGDRMYSNIAMAEDMDRVRAAYGVNYDRLVQVKTKYDPTNFFRMNHNIKPAV
jgi:hypothetical protein